MSATTSIEWTDATWNPIRGCTRVSEGCRNCYAEAMAARFSRPGQWGHGIAEMRDGQPRWTGRVDVVDDALTLPLRWRKPRRIFVNSISDLFHPAVSDETIDRVFAVTQMAHWHTYVILTKRSARMREHVQSMEAAGPLGIIRKTIRAMAEEPDILGWPLSNVCLGVSVEDQPTADEHIPNLEATAAAWKMISYEPALGPVDFRKVPGFNRVNLNLHRWWVVVGGESGPNARPMHPAWARSIRDQCQNAGVPFFFKQWGEWLHWSQFCEAEIDDDAEQTRFETIEFDEDSRGWRRIGHPMWCDTVDGSVDEDQCVGRVGKKRAGRMLDGREWNEMPFTRS